MFAFIFLTAVMMITDLFFFQQTYLKEILNEVCDYNVKNPHRNMWELKPEYRHYKADEVEAADDPGSD